jgi:hypothetical protein
MPAKRASKISVKGASLKEGLCESKKKCSEADKYQDPE